MFLLISPRCTDGRRWKTRPSFFGHSSHFVGAPSFLSHPAVGLSLPPSHLRKEQMVVAYARNVMAIRLGHTTKLALSWPVEIQNGQKSWLIFSNCEHRLSKSLSLQCQRMIETTRASSRTTFSTALWPSPLFDDSRHTHWYVEGFIRKGIVISLLSLITSTVHSYLFLFFVEVVGFLFSNTTKKEPKMKNEREKQSTTTKRKKNCWMLAKRMTGVYDDFCCTLVSKHLTRVNDKDLGR